MGRTFALDDSDVAVIGRACRLPGAANPAELWALLHGGRCAVSVIPEDRWPLSRHGHPRPKEPGRSYTWAAGVLPDIWGFDPSVFRVSPREAQQMDPQQRLMLELAFEACEDGGFAPSKLAGSQTGVYVGASALDYSTFGLHDFAGADAYYATGNALSIVSNRLSYAFDLHGPSLTIDTACSSSLVALHQARQALVQGEIDVALVGGVNALVSPFGFVSFSQATMLSPTGLCRAFAAEADGYVRAEGGLVLVLKALKKAIADGDRIHAVICGSAVNSDGRTSGISMPAEKYQIELLRSLYGPAGVAPDSVAFVEAHGTGTRVGDPVEASALGTVLGRARSRPLPIGSIKTNIGHTEPASGLAGLMKAMLALEHDESPPSLHAANLNPGIDFVGLNLQVASHAIALSRTPGRRYAGVSSFGFGGTSAHVVISDGPVARASADPAPRLLMISAQTEEALRALAGAYATRLDAAGARERSRIVAATGRRRERMRERLALPAQNTAALAPALARFARSDEADATSVRATAVEGDGAIVFVFSGNGSQWSGMGRAAYQANAAFRDALAEIDSHFLPLAGWSLVEELDSADIATDLARTDVAQPLIFAIQAASVRALARVGVRPALTVGHSVGEVAAAEAAGVLSLSDAIRVIFHRSRLQQATENAGGMAVVFGPRESAAELVSRIPGLSIAAHNSHRCVAVAGPQHALDRLMTVAPGAKLRARRLDLPYPFHTELMQSVKKPLIEALATLKPSTGSVPFLSTVAGELVQGPAAGAAYWWRNVRQVVQFQEGVERALGAGKRVFLEIGPRPTLKSHLRDAAEHLNAAALVDCVLDESAVESGDPFEAAAMRLIAGGADVGQQWAFGPDPGPGVALPAYPWRRAPYRFPETTEATGRLSVRPRHPLTGAREADGSLEWRAIVDPQAVPALADHRVDGQTLLPGAAFLEMGLAVARDWAGPDVALRDFEIQQPLAFSADVSREILSRIEASTATVEILSRPRLAKAPFTLHARGRIVQKPGPAPELGSVSATNPGAVTGEEVYARARTRGLDFGPAFQGLAQALRVSDDLIEVRLTDAAGDPRYGLDPARLDSCFHGLILLFAARDGEGGAYLPVRFGEARLFLPNADIASAKIRLRRFDDRILVADFEVFDRQARPAARILGVRCQAARPRASARLSDLALAPRWVAAAVDLAGGPPLEVRPTRAEPSGAAADLSEVALVLEGWATAAAFEFARDLATEGVIDLDLLVPTGRLPESRRVWAESLLTELERSGLLERSGRILRLNDLDLPSAQAVFSTIASQHPERAAELLLAAGAGEALRALAAGAADVKGPSDNAIEGYDLRSVSATAAAGALERRLEAVAPVEVDRVSLRILQVGAGAASSVALRFAEARGARVTLLEPDARQLERVRFAQGGATEVSFCADLDTLPDSGFDLVVSGGGLTRLGYGREALARLARKCAPGAALVSVEPTPSLFHLVTLAFAEAAATGAANNRLGPDAWTTECARGGFRVAEARLVDTGEERATLLGATAPEAASILQPSRPVTILASGDDGSGFAAMAQRAVEAQGAPCHLAEGAIDLKKGQMRTLLWIAGDRRGDGAARASAHCLALRDLALTLAESKVRLVVAAPSTDPPMAEALFAFARTLANEFPTIDFRRVELAETTPQSAERLAAILLSDCEETDVLVGAAGARVLRYAAPALGERGPTASEGFRSRLEKNSEPGLDRLAWKVAARADPGANEVEVQVAATGLNFRDVMWTLSILPDEMLEDGYAGATLGLEFAGRVVRVGEGVSHLKPGDAVVGLVGGAFASHVVVNASLVAPLPPTLGCESAAAVPVAFLTAYYGLISCAGLEPGEWALIHGGAGGVGLAALQIAGRRGARVIVTAGSSEKRALALALGAEHAFDSRSGAFVDDVMRATQGQGVSVVLNSLAGEAMERSLGLLRPFGRFVELGKRDYLVDTPLGLRPFRRNLSYFGVDLDQLLAARPEISRRLFDEVMALFASGELTPPPFTVFAHDEVVEAMRLMQQSGHIGKILVRPPPPEAIRASDAPMKAFAADPNGVHLVTGGLSGFGLAAAEWLADRGARRLALVGRSGAASETAQSAVAALERRGVEVRVGAFDISDGAATERFLADVAATMAPLVGVIHAAMVLDDAIAANLDEARLLKVLKPKIAGAEILDRLTRNLSLDYFVLFSSATAAIGNPGQGAYVTGNGFLEGLARRRRSAGRPALAVGWGAIADVGVVARSGATRDSLAQRAGAKGVKARVALDALGEALADPNVGPSLLIAEMNWTTARANLPLLTSPTYGRLARGAANADPAADAAVDLADLVTRLGQDQARRAVVEILVEEIGRILQLPRNEVNRTKPLAEIGLDSLMAVELAMSLERRFGLDGPLAAAAGGLSVGDLAGHLLATRGELTPLSSTWPRISPSATSTRRTGARSSP